MKHKVNFKEGMNHCKLNSDFLITSGKIIINHEDGTKPYGLFLLYIAYEELAKSIFCFFIDKEWVSYDFVKDVFDKHDYKLFLFDEIFLSFEVVNGVGYLGGKKLGDLPLSHFIDKHKESIATHRDLTKKFLYVEPMGNHWHIPSNNIKEIKNKQKIIEEKINALDLVLHSLEDSKNLSLLNNFKFYKSKDGNPTIQFDSI